MIGPDVPAAGGHGYSSNPPATRVPMPALWLGALGAIPFVGLAAGGFLADDGNRDAVVFALAAYGAVILSFLGGIHWGLAMAGFGTAVGRNLSLGRLSLSVVPSLIGWASLLLPSPAGLAVLAGAFAGMLALDALAARRRQVPAWYLRLRWPLTLTVVASVTAGAFA